jgi:hypothetical protein
MHQQAEGRDWAIDSHNHPHFPPRAGAMSLKEGVGYRSNQGMIWDDLALNSDRMAVHSATWAMVDLFEGQKDRLGKYRKAFRLVDCQVRAVFALG